MARKYDWEPKRDDMSRTAFVQRVRHLDTHIHLLAAKAAIKGQSTKKLAGLVHKDWDRMYRKLMKLAGTKQALELAAIDD